MIKASSFVLLSLTVFFSNHLLCQNVKGYVYNIVNYKPIENVNIYIPNSNIGTSTDKLGYFELTNNENLINLIISHISYENKKIEINTNSKIDTIVILLNPISIELQESVINANVENEISRDYLSVIDFNFINNNILILAKNFSNNNNELIVTNSVFDTIAIIRCELLNSAKKIYKDCLGRCHVINRDSAYQISFQDSILYLKYPTLKTKFFEVLQDCLFELDENIFFKTTSENGFFNEFYAINTTSKSKKIIYSGYEIEKLKQLNFEINWIKSHPHLYSNIYEAILFEKQIMFKPSDISLYNIGDSIYLFNHSKGNLDIYSDDIDYIRSIQINYHFNKNWKNKLIFDRTENKVYTTIAYNNFEELFEINLINGNIETKYKIPFLFPYKIMVNSGYVYFLCKDKKARNEHKKGIYSFKL
ncbi:MAG: carboxypeptidase-like regulatory domain-containing protein [Bacteroidales bacterium]